jgi:hypothetical protein
MVTTIPYEKVNAMTNFAATFGGRKIFGGSNVVLPLDKKFIRSVYEEFSQFTLGNERMSESIILFELVPFKKIASVPMEETAFANRGDYYGVGTLFKWYDPAQDEMVRTFNRKLNRRIKEEGGVKKSLGVGVYSNYMCEWNWLSHHFLSANGNLDSSKSPEEVFGTNTPRLKELKMKYDPQNLFYRWHNLLAN